MEPFIEIREVKVSYNPIKAELPRITTSKEAYDYLCRSFDADTMGMCEEFIVLLLNRNNRVLGYYKLSKGGLGGTVVDLRLLFGTALKAMASGLILAHNHPSNNLKPSNEDLRITQRIKEAGKLLDVQVMDHLILGTNDNYVSFTDEGWL
jgi:DNA repair protein RadC